MQEGSDTPQNGPTGGAHVITDADLLQLENDLRVQYDDTLAGLLRVGLDLLHSSGPGVPLLIAHAGRELSHGVRRHLEVEEGITRSIDDPRDDGEKSVHRERLAAILGLHRDHDLVRRWSRAFDSLMPIVHYNGKTPSHSTAAGAFRDLAGVVYSLVGHFGTMKRELCSLAAIDTPSDQEAKRAVQLLMRAQQRTIFYARLQSPRWLSLLTKEGQFRSPPDRIVQGDRWWVGPWPERDYLIRVASEVPEEVRDVFLAVPLTNTNPRVWGAAAEAARRMPADAGSAVARHLAKAIPRVPPLFVTRPAMQLAIALSTSVPDAAMELLKAMLTFNRFEQAFPEKEEPDILHGFRRGTTWMLKGLERHDLDDLAGKVIPALASARPVELASLLISQLRFAMIQMRRMETGSKQEDHSSQHWCEHLEWRKNALDSGDLRAILATSLWRVIVGHCQTTPEHSSQVVKLLSGYSDDLLLRLRAKFLAHSPYATTGEIDAMLAHPFVLDVQHGRGEVGEFLVKCFGRSSEDARAKLASRIDAGPSSGEILSIIAVERLLAARGAGQPAYLIPESMEETDEPERVRAKQRWQARRLALFGEHLPAELVRLDEDLRHAHVDFPRPEEKEEREDRAHEELETSEATISTESAVDLSGMSDADVARKLAVAVESDEAAPRAASAALSDGLRSVLAAMPDRTGGLLRALIQARVDPSYVSIVTDSLLTLTRQRQEVPWQDVLATGGALLDSVSRSVREGAGAGESSGSPFDETTNPDQWQSALAAYLSAISTAVRARQIPVESTRDLARLLDLIVDFWCTNRFNPSSITAYPEKRRLSMGETLASVVVDITASASYWLHEIQTDSARSEPCPAAELAIGDRIDRLLDSSDPQLSSVISAIGDILPFLVLSEGDWLERKRALLFAEERLEVVLESTVLRFGYFREIFAFLRPEFCRLVDLLAHEEEGRRGGEAREAIILSGLTPRVRDAWLDGRVDADDDDQLAPRVFALTSADGKNRAYWGIFRSWTDAKKPISGDAVERCLSLWRWRLDVLERMKPSKARASEAEELLWLLSTPFLPVPEVLALAMRTVRLAPTRIPPLSRLDVIVAADPVGAYDLFALMARNSMSTRSSYLDVGEVAGAFRFVLSGDDETRRAEARVLLDQLGRRVDPAFSDLESSS